MPKFLSDFFNNYGVQAYTPTEAGVMGQKSAAFTQIVSKLISGFTNNLTPSVQIPQKLAQAIISFYTAFRANVEGSERLQHALLALLASAQLGLALDMLFEERHCDDDYSGAICRSAFVLEIVYTTILSLGWGRGEVTAYLQRAQRIPQPAPADNSSPVNNASNAALPIQSVVIPVDNDRSDDHNEQQIQHSA